MYLPSHTDGIDPTIFANAVATAVEQMLVARMAQSMQERALFAITRAFSEPDIIDYSIYHGAKIASYFATQV